MNYSNCIRPDVDCSLCSAYDDNVEECLQDDDLGGTGHGDYSYSDADPGL